MLVLIQQQVKRFFENWHSANEWVYIIMQHMESLNLFLTVLLCIPCNATHYSM